jgi:hypothetical protein
MRWYVSAPGARDARYGETESVGELPARVPHRVASLSAGVGSAAALFYAAFDARYDLVSCAGRTVAVANVQLKRGLQAASVLIRADVDTGSPRGRRRHIEAVAHAASNPGTVLLVSGRKHCGNALVDSMLAQACPCRPTTVWGQTGYPGRAGRVQWRAPSQLFLFADTSRLIATTIVRAG